MGSKRRIVKEILPIMMKDMDENTAFVDVFCSGCHVIEQVPSNYRRIANDKNKLNMNAQRMYANIATLTIMNVIYYRLAR